MYDSNQQIVFTSIEPSLAVIYDTKTGLHSVYKIRKASTEECQLVCGNGDTTPSIFNQSASASPLNVGSNLSQNKSCTNKGHLSIFGKHTKLPFRTIPWNFASTNIFTFQEYRILN